MKTHHLILPALAASSLLLFTPSVVAQTPPPVTSSVKARAEASGGSESSHKQTVTVTSDGKRTVKKTVTVRDGVEEVVVEITDENGKKTTTRNPGKSGGAGDKPEAGPWLGVRVKEAPAVVRDQLGLENDEGVVVDVLAPDGPAAKAGVQVNDILLKLAGRKLSRPEDVEAELRSRKIGESVAVELLRKGQRHTLDVTLAARPADQAAGEPPPAAMELLPKAGAGTAGHGGSGGASAKVEIETNGDASAGLDAVLDNPNVPEDFKKTVREMKEKLREFEKQHGVKPDKH
jgi:membrane-associated protease RseP (regulator of RpoE activity)